MKQALVTGGAGFIGSSMVRGLLAAGWRVRVLDNFSTGYRHNIEEVADRIELHEASIVDYESCLAACRDCRVVIHLAADVSVPRSMVDPENTHRTNVDGLYNILSASRTCGVKRVVLASSSAVYGENPDQPKQEDMASEPISPYGASKAIGELYCQAFTRSFGLETVSLRYFNVFGPRQDPKSVYAAAIPAFVSRLMSGQRPIIFGTGEQSRDFTYVENVVQANLLAAEAPMKGPVTANIAGGKATTVNEIVQVIRRLLGADELEPQYEPVRAGDILHSWADISRAEKVLGYRPQVDFSEGLRRTIEWYKANLK